MTFEGKHYVDYRKRTEEKARVLEEAKGDILIGRYVHFAQAETVKDYFKNIHSKCQIISEKIDGELTYSVVMPFIQNKVTWMRFISAMVDKRMRWEHWQG